MTRVLLAGAFGQGNPGDEALLASFTRGLSDMDLAATTDRPEETGTSFPVNPVHRFDSRSVAENVARADAVVFAGGTVFKTLHPASGRRPLSLLRRALTLAVGTRAMRKRLALVGVGADELQGKTAKRIAREIVHRSDLLILRDEESAELLAETGAPRPFRVGADPAWTVLPRFQPQERRGGKVIVALSHLAGGDELPGRLADALEPLAQAGVPLLVQPWQTLTDGGVDDAVLAAKLARCAPGAFRIIDPPESLDAAVRLFQSEASLVIGMRFHSVVAAAAAGVPFVAVGHEPKLSALARRLDQPCVDSEVLGHRLAPVALAHLNGQPARHEEVVAESDLAAESLRLLRVLLSAGRAEEPESIAGLRLEPRGWAEST